MKIDVITSIVHAHSGFCRWGRSDRGGGDEVVGTELELEAAVVRRSRRSSANACALSSTTVGSRRFWPSGLMAPTT